MTSAYVDSLETGEDAFAPPPAAPARPFDDDGFLGYDPRLPSQRFDAFDLDSLRSASEGVPSPTAAYAPSPPYAGADDDSLSSQPPISAPGTPSTPPIYAGAQGLSPDPRGFAQFRESNGKAADGAFEASDGPILPPLAQMEPEEGFALREWRRLVHWRLIWALLDLSSGFYCVQEEAIQFDGSAEPIFTYCWLF